MYPRSRRHFARSGWLALLVLGTLATASVARADEAVLVLGVTSVEGDDEVARNVTGAMRNAASHVAGWHALDSEVTLAQMSLVHGCPDEPDTTCLASIATALSAQRVVFGLLRRDRNGYQLSAGVYSVATNTIEHTAAAGVPRTQSDIDDLRAPARQVISALSAPLTGSLRVVTDAPGASVFIDGTDAGLTDGQGVFTSSALGEGPHQLEVRAAGRTPARGAIQVNHDQETVFDANLPRARDREAPVASGGTNWAAVTLFTVGAASVAASIAPMARLGAIQANGEYDAYRRWAELPPPGNVCAAARAGRRNEAAPNVNVATIASYCDEADTMEIVEFVLIGVGAASITAAAVLWIIDAVGGSNSEAQSVLLVPTFDAQGGRLDLSLRF
jgi:PEGA domain